MEGRRGWEQIRVMVRLGEKGSKEREPGYPCLVSRELMSTLRSAPLPTSRGKAAFPAPWDRVMSVYTAGRTAVHATSLMPALGMYLGAC